MVRAVGSRHGLLDGDLDEVLQGVRIRLWRARPSPESLDSVTTSYVYHAAVSAALDLLRRRRAFGASRTAPLHLVADPIADRADPARELAGRELGDRIAAAVDAIPMPRRAVVRMHLEGYDRMDIAELMGWSESKTRNLLYRGLADLRDRLRAAGLSLDEALHE